MYMSQLLISENAACEFQPIVEALLVPFFFFLNPKTEVFEYQPETVVFENQLDNGVELAV